MNRQSQQQIIRSHSARNSRGKRASMWKAAMLATLALSPAAQAELIWDGDGVLPVSGGAGTWDTTATNWLQTDLTTPAAWPVLGDEQATFGTAGGAITLDIAVKANALKFDVTGYSVAGLGTLEMVSGSLGAPTIQVTNATDTTTIGTILAGAGLTKIGAGALALTGINTLTGTVTVNDGTLSFGAVSALNTATEISVASGKTLRYTGAVAETLAPALSGGGFVDVNNAAGVLTVTSVTGTGITKAGDGTLELAGTSANTYAGTFLVNRGTVLLSKTSGNAITGDVDLTPAGGGSGHPTIKLMAAEQISDFGTVMMRGVAGAGGGNFQLNGFNETIGALVIDNNQGTGSVTIDTGAGMLTLNGNVSVSGTSSGSVASPITGLLGNHIAGNLNLGGGTRNIDVSATAGATVSAVISNGGITKTGSGVLTLSGANTFNGGVTVYSGILAVSADNNLGDSAGTVTLDGGTLRIANGTTLARAITLNGNSGNGIEVATSGTATVSGLISGFGGFTKTGGGTLALTGTTANTFLGPINVYNGTIELNKTGVNAISAAGASVITNSTAPYGAGTIRLLAANQIDDSAPISLSASGQRLAMLDINDLTETVGALTLTSVTDAGARVRLGATGTLVLNGDLVFNNNRNATGNTGREVFITGTGDRNTAGPGGTLDLGGVARNIIVNTTVTTPANLTNTDATIDAAIINGSIVKSGSRVLRLGNINTYSALTINNGGVRALVDGAIPAGIPLVVSGASAGTTATLDFGGFNYTLTAANNLQFGGGSGGNTIATGAGTLTLSTDITVDTSANAETSTISGKLDLGGASRTFTVGDSSATATDLIISAAISGTGDIIKEGAGTMSLRAQNTSWTGNLLLNQGTIRFDAGLTDNTQFNNIMGAAGNGISVNGGTIQASMHTTANVDRTLTNRTVTVGAGGVTFDILGNYVNFVEGNYYSQLRFAGTTGLVVGSDPLTKTGGGRLQFQTAAPNYSGPVTLNDGTLEASGVALGDSSATNTITINGGNWAVSADSTQPLVTLNGGAISTNGGNRILSGNVDVTGNSYVFLNNFWTDASSGWTMTLNGTVTGAGNLLVGVNRAGYDNNSGTLRLSNPANTYSGIITVEKNLKLENSSATGTGKTLGTASVVLAGGTLRLRDNGVGSNGILAYGTNVTVADTAGNGDLAGTATIDVDRASGTNTGNLFQMGTLTIGSQQLNVTAANGYGVSFGGVTTLTGYPTFNVTGGTMTLAGGIAGAGLSFTKSGAGTLRLLGTVDIAGYSLLGGTLETAVEPAAGRSLALPLGVGFGAGYVATQANLIDHVTLDSEGVVALGMDSTFNPDFSLFVAGPNSQRLRFGATTNSTLTGTFTPHSDNMVRLGGGGATLTIASADAISGTASLDVNTSGTAPGTVVLAAANNFSGTLAIGGGMTLRAAQNASLGTNTTSAIGMDNGTLVLATGGDFTGFGARKLNIGAGGATLDTGGSDVSLTEILGTGAFTKAGAGRLTLATGNANFTGASAITGGIVNIQNAVSLGTATSNIPVSAGAALEIQGGITLARPVSISGTGVGDTGALRNISGDNTITGIVTTTGATSILADAGSLTINVASGDALTGTAITIGGAGNITIADPTRNTITSTTKVGAGTLTFTGDPNHTGTFTINEGTVVQNHSGSTDANIVVNPGGTLSIVGDNRLGDNYDVTLNGTGAFNVQGTDTIDQLLGDGSVNSTGSTAARTLTVTAAGGATTFSGTLQDGGSFALNFAKGSSANAVTLTGASTYTGATTVGGGGLRVEGNVGSIAGSTQITLNRSDSVLSFGSNADTNATVDRIKDTTEIEMQDGSNLIFNGANDLLSPTAETFGQLETNTGHNTVTLVPAAGAQIAVTGSTLLRSGSGTLVFRGTGLGGSGADSSRLFFTTAPTGTALVGGAGAAGTTNQSIIPFVVGDSSATGHGTTLVTYDAATGVRPLVASEYATAIADGVISTNNVSLAVPAALTNRVTAINSLRLETGGAVNMSAGGTLRVTSGAILDASATGGTISGGAIIFGTQPAVFQLSGETASTPITTVVNSNISGSGGLSVSAANPASVLALGGFNAITGEIAINKGVLRLDSPNALNPFSRVTFRFSSEASTANAVLRLNGQTSVEAFLNGSGWGVIENGGAAPATIGFTLGSDTDSTNITLRDGGSAPLNIIKMGGSRLSFQNDSSITGTVTVREGAFELKDGSDFDSLGGVIVEGGTFKVYNTNSNNNTDRVPAAMTATLRGGTFYADTNTDSGTSFSERVGKLTIDAGVNNAQVDWHTTATRTSTLWFWDPAGVNATDSIARNPGAVLNLVAAGATGGGLGSTAQGMIRIGADTVDPSASLLKNGILHKNGVAGWAVVGDNFPTVSGDLVATGNIEHSLTALTTYQASTDATAWLATDNVKLSSAVTVPLAAPATINSLILADGVNLDLNAQTLTVDTGGILAITSTASGPTKTISNGTLTAGDFAGSELVIRAGDNANTANAAGVNISATIADASVTNRTALTKWGGKTLTLSGNNTLTGNVHVTQGTLAATSAANLGVAVSGRTLKMASNTTLDLSASTASETLPFDVIESTVWGSAAAAGSNGVATITGASGQTLSFTGTLGGIGALRFHNPVNLNIAVPNLGGALTVGAPNATPVATALAATITLAAGDNQIGGSLQLGVNQMDATMTQSSGTLRVGFQQYLPELNIGYRTSDSVSTSTLTRGTLDLTGTTNFEVQANNIRLGVITGAGSSGGAEGNLIIGQNSTLRAGATFFIGDSTSAGNTTVTSDITFGTGSNLVEAPQWVVGGRKSTAAAAIAAGGTLTFSGIAGAAGNLSVGDQLDTDNTGTVSTGTLNMTGGTLIATINALEIGDKQRNSGNGGSGGATGTMTLGNAANSVIANSMLLGRMQRGTGTAGAGSIGRGTLSFGGGAFEVLGDVTMGEWVAGTETKGTALGTLNITGGTFSVSGNIVKTDNDRSAAMIAVDGGTLDMQNQARGDTAVGSITASQLAFRSGSIVDAASVTLDGRGVTNGTTFAALDQALIVRDVALNVPINLTNATADKGGIQYEAAGGGTGGTLSGAVNLGLVGRTISVEDSAGASADLTIAGAVTGTTLTKTGPGHLVLAGSQSYAALVNNAGKTSLNTALGTGTSTIAANSAEGVVLNTHQKLAGLTVAGATNAWTGKLDLNDNGVVLTAGGTALADVVNQVKQGRNDGSWTGLGITSAAAATDARRITAVGVILNNDEAAAPAPIQMYLNGMETGLNDVLVKYTYNGDSDLSGTVDADDYFQIDAGFLSAGAKSGWRWGDYNYDGLIDIDDYFLIDVAYSLQGNPLSGSASVAPSASSAAVPEPGTLSLLALGAAALLGRRRRTK